MEVAISTNQLVTFQLEDDIFGIDIMSTQEILKLNRLRQIPNSPMYFEGMLDLRGDVLPVINFKKLFAFGTFDLSKDRGIIILKVDNMRFGVIIDKILRVITLEQAEVKQVPESFSKTLKQYIVGVIEYQQELISILDIKAIFQTINQELGMGTDIDNITLDFRRDKYDLLTPDHEKDIFRFLNSINFKANAVTFIGVKNYFSRQMIRSRISLETIVHNAKKSIKETPYNLFSNEKSDYFFDHFDDYYDFLAILEHVIIPMKIKKNDWNLKIVNLNCSKGMEILSLLFALKSYLPNFDKWTVELVAFGDNYSDLTIANESIYSAESLIRMNNIDLQNFFDKEDKGYRVKTDLKEKVSYRYGSAKNFETIKNVDLFFCRGIFNDMDDQSVTRVVMAIKESMTYAGILVLSQIEDLLLINQPLITREINGRKYYINI